MDTIWFWMEIRKRSAPSIIVNINLKSPGSELNFFRSTGWSDLSAETENFIHAVWKDSDEEVRCEIKKKSGDCQKTANCIMKSGKNVRKTFLWLLHFDEYF